MLGIPKEGKRRKNKNTPAKFSDKIKVQMLKRDGGTCIFSDILQPWECGKIIYFHHYLYGYEAERGEDRNNVDKGVCLCDICHYEIHHGVRGFSSILRQKCKDYLLNYYNAS